MGLLLSSRPKKNYICNMNELLRHIERLLVENECVIIPDFGGFVTYYAPARHLEKERLFLPPYRTVGFNPLLRMNDGLLIQSYMQKFEVSYPVAQRMVEAAVDELSDVLHEEGCVKMPGLGELSLNAENLLEFHPSEDGIVSPMLYGWAKFEMQELKDLPHVVSEEAKTRALEPKKGNNSNVLVINVNRTWLNNIVAVAAAVILFFFLSVPVDNTYVEPESYASLGDAGWFEQIRPRSFATTVIDAPQTPARKETVTPQTPKKKIHEEKIALVKTPAASGRTKAPEVAAPKKVMPEAQPAAPEKAVRQAPRKQYHIIVASVGSRADAETVVSDLAAKGYPGATVIERDGRVRVALMSGTDKEAINAKMLQLRKKDMFKQAWMLTTRR